MGQEHRNHPIELGPRPNHLAANPAKLTVRHVSFWYGAKQALKNVSIDIYDKEVTAFIGPSGCGKTTLLCCLNRTSEIVEATRMEGEIRLGDVDLYDPLLDPPEVRRRFGWVAQRPNPFARSIRKNVVYGPRIHGLVTRSDEEQLVWETLHAVGLWDEVKDRLSAPASDLSIGQQQRLCIARAIAIRPEVLLMDEPCSALDPVSTARIEDLIDELRKTHCIIIITHNLQQAARISQRVAFFHLGELVEAGDTQAIFVAPTTKRCADFVTGRYG